MALHLWQVSLPHDSGLPEDVAVNTFHFDMDEVLGAGTANYADVAAMLQNFYGSTPPGGTAPLAQYLSSVLTGQGILRAYRLADPEPRTPRYTVTQTYGTGSAATGNLPSECAIRISFTADPVSGVPAGRLRGGPFIGPLHIAAKEATGIPRVAAVALGNLVDAATELVAAADASISNRFVIRSEVGNIESTVTGGFVDNAFDTIRKRGEAATVRTTF